MKRVVVNRVYRFRPNLVDIGMPQHYKAKRGQLVRVINLPHAPPANTMGQCHIEDADNKKFLGMVSTGSLLEVEEN